MDLFLLNGSFVILDSIIFFLYFRNMLKGISTNPIQLNPKPYPSISNFAYLQVRDSHSNTSPLPYHHPYETYSHHRQKRRTKREPTSVSDALSSNITEILETLLKNYDKTERPFYRKGKFLKLILPDYTLSSFMYFMTTFVLNRFIYFRRDY